MGDGEMGRLRDGESWRLGDWEIGRLGRVGDWRWGDEKFSFFLLPSSLFPLPSSFFLS
jgi:hypothetical protein